MGSLTQRSATRMEKLVEASRHGDWQQMTALLRNIPESFRLGKNGEFALQEMVRHGHLAVIDILLDRGVSPIATDPSGMAPLHIAAVKRHEHVVRHLINNAPLVKENINQVCGDGQTAYQLAKVRGFDELASMLVELGAEPRDDVISRSGSTPTLSGAEAHDFVLKIYQRENSVDESIVTLQAQIRDMMLLIQKSFNDMKKAISGIVGKQARDVNRQLAELKNQMQQVEDNIVDETKAINCGMDTLRTRTEELRTTFHQAEEYNDILYFHVFHIIAKTVGMKRNTWKDLCRSLLADYPKPLVDKIMREVKSNHTSEEDMAYEILTKWKLYNQHTPDKVGTLKDAVTRVHSRIDSLVADIDAAINHHHKATVKTAKDVLSDGFLVELAGEMRETDYTMIGTRLGTSAVRLDQLRHDSQQDSRTRNFNMLVQWRDRQEGTKVTILSRLIEAFKAAGRRDLCEKIRAT